MKTTKRRNTKSIGIGRTKSKISAKKAKYVVYSSTLAPRHRTVEQLTRAVEEVIAARKTKAGQSK